MNAYGTLYGPVPTPALDRFWSKVKSGDGGCWLWQGAQFRWGYGKFWDGHSVIRAHRFAYIMFKGTIPLGFHLDHLCRVPACVNPSHLEAVTPKEHAQRSTN